MTLCRSEGQFSGDSGDGSVVANHDDGESLVVVTILTWCIHGQNHCVPKRVGHFEHKFKGNGASPTNSCWHHHVALFA